MWEGTVLLAGDVNQKHKTKKNKKQKKKRGREMNEQTQTQTKAGNDCDESSLHNKAGCELVWVEERVRARE